MARGSGFIWFLIYIIFGLYFLNYGLSFYMYPEPIKNLFDSINKWISIIGGVLIILGGINYYRARRYTTPPR